MTSGKIEWRILPRLLRLSSGCGHKVISPVRTVTMVLRALSLSYEPHQLT